MEILDEPVSNEYKRKLRSGQLSRPKVSREIRALLQSELYGVLCSHGEGQAYGSVVAFAFSRDLKNLFFSTPVNTRKYKLLRQSPGVAFVVDNRCRFRNDMAKVEAITATGRARLIRSGAKRKTLARLLIRRHPQFKSFVSAPSCAIFEMKIVRYLHVVRVQEVTQWLPNRAG